MPWPTTSRHERGYGRQHERIREQLQREVILCEHCTKKGIVRPGRIADHIVPLAKGGSGERSNYQWLCQPCSDAKTARENAEAQGRTYRPKVRISVEGWPEGS